MKKKKRKRKVYGRRAQQLAVRKPRTDIHHFYWVKKWYGQNRLIELDYDFHHSYHAHFQHRCNQWQHRACNNGVICIYEAICCYCKTKLDFGQRVPQTSG